MIINTNQLCVAGNLASIYYEQGNLEMAILNYKRAIAFDSGFLEAFNNLVCSLINLNSARLFSSNDYMNSIFLIQ